MKNAKKLYDFEEFQNEHYSEFTQILVQKIEEDLEEVEDREILANEILDTLEIIMERCYAEGHLDGYRLCDWLHHLSS